MKTINFEYNNSKSLGDFISNNQISDNSKLLIQVFTAQASKAAIQSIQTSFQTYFSKATLIGASSDGNIIDAQVPPIGQTTVSFTQFEQTDLVSTFLDHPQNSYRAGLFVGSSMAQQSDIKTIITFTDGIHSNGETYLNGVSEACPNTVISGGMAGDNGLLKETFVFTLNEITSCGVVAVGLKNPNLIVQTRYNFDWNSVGKPMKVTRSHENLVMEIDRQPAIKVYEKYLGREVANKLPATGIEFPLVKLENDTWVGRAVIAVKDSGGLLFAGNLNEGDIVQFGIANKDSFMSDAYSTLLTLDKTPVESLFVYSCMARRRFLGDQAACELAQYGSNLHVTGFYTYGEFYYSMDRNKANLLNQTMTLLALSESESSLLDVDKGSSDRNCRKHRNDQSDTLSAVSHLAVSVSNDLAMLNTMLEHEVDVKTKELINRSLTDELTNLPNRQTLLNDLRNSIDETLIVLNIKDFSKINGFYGLDSGDELLLKVGIKLNQELRNLNNLLPQAKLYKLPSDEYAIITKSSDNKAIELGIKKLNQAVFADTFRVLDFNILVNAIWVYNRTDQSEKCLLQAEISGKDARINKTNIVRSSSTHFSETKARIGLAHKVRDALLSGRVYPVFQPIFNNRTGQIDKYECLARMKTEEGEVITPYHFIEIAKMIQMYSVLTEVMIYKSFKHFQGTGLNFSINLSIDDIENITTQAVLFDAIQQFGVAEQLTIEILENQELTESSDMYHLIERLKKLGVKIAIDDFGSGFANYEHLAKLKADIVKIDGKLIQNINTDLVSNSVIDSILIFAKQLNIDVVAEFVSDQSIYEKVKEKGIDFSQGYHLSEPLAEL